MSADLREGWVVMVDPAGREVSNRVPVLADPDGQLIPLDDAVVVSGAPAKVRFLDQDGQARDTPL